MRKKEVIANSIIRYNTGNCPRCNGLIGWEDQAGSMPPSWHCLACGCRVWNWRALDLSAVEYAQGDKLTLGGKGAWPLG